MDIIKTLAAEFKIKNTQVEQTVALIDEGNTIPFIARYRKEATGGLSDVVLRDMDERLTYLRGLEERKEDVIRLIDEQGKLTEELREQILEADVLQRVEDLYKPFKKKKATRASKAKEKGLEPLADIIWSQECTDAKAEAEAFVDPEKEVRAAKLREEYGYSTGEREAAEMTGTTYSENIAQLSVERQNWRNNNLAYPRTKPVEENGEETEEDPGAHTPWTMSGEGGKSQ